MNDPRSSTFFVRYRLINKGTVSQVLDSVYFAAWSDTDLGDYADDISGCDTILNAGYIYNDVYDNVFGSNPPAHFIQILQGPIVYIPGITFIDNNSNSIYDDGIDVAIDTAFNMKGNVLGIETYPGAKNLNMTSFLSTYKSYIPRIDPMDKNQANLILRGHISLGSKINPCNDPLGVILGGINCNQINPLFAYSGDPLWQTGCINVRGGDLRQYASTSPFKLIANTPVDILIAHGCFRDTGSTSSIRSGKIYSTHLQQFYLSNFTSIQTSVENENKILIDRNQLYQNYPNPSNPKTKIKY